MEKKPIQRHAFGCSGAFQSLQPLENHVDSFPELSAWRTRRRNIYPLAPVLHCLRAATRISALQFCLGSILSLALETTLGRKQEGTAYLRQVLAQNQSKPIRNCASSSSWHQKIGKGLWGVAFLMFLLFWTPVPPVYRLVKAYWTNGLTCENIGSKEHKLNSGKGKTCCVFTDCESVGTGRHVEERQELR